MTSCLSAYRRSSSALCAIGQVRQPPTIQIETLFELLPCAWAGVALVEGRRWKTAVTPAQARVDALDPAVEHVGPVGDMLLERAVSKVVPFRLPQALLSHAPLAQQLLTTPPS